MRVAERLVAVGAAGADLRGPPHGSREREGVLGGIKVAEEQQDRADEEGDGAGNGEDHPRRPADKADGLPQGTEFAAALAPGALPQGTDFAAAAAKFVLGLGKEAVE
ncbi:hypothetical protein GCM10017674_78490 [Streptomyces gardneri]|uniref:Uncharacterized protein n=1 Tax=Streptomyces gardneri TaxID=66892 RepID=A0A4Y3RH90_9ACTN|nr:hypothetical protein SGA01_27760 [Streptomyces gardneri]GHH22591.1 hypothetical protein GCM10017674_78490 [Streptomyces gardneri]